MLPLVGLLARAVVVVAAATTASGKRCACTGSRATDPACCWQGHAFVPNALERTPLRGWRSWQAYSQEINQVIMEDTMRGLAKQRQLGGEFSSLAAAGYTDVGLDAGYEMIGEGYGGSCHTRDGHMLVNRTRFPSFKKMTDTAHALHLTASWYLNNDPCKGANETAVGPTYVTDSTDAVAFGFDGKQITARSLRPSTPTVPTQLRTGAGRALARMQGSSSILRAVAPLTTSLSGRWR
jgi:mono/diheme cytochrome c family protein